MTRMEQAFTLTTPSPGAPPTQEYPEAGEVGMASPEDPQLIRLTLTKLISVGLSCGEAHSLQPHRG